MQDSKEVRELSLHIACREGNLEQIRSLIESKIDINSITEDFDNKYYNYRTSPLLTAITQGNEHVVRLLLEKQASLQVRPYNNNYPLIAACKKGNKEIIRLLIHAKADINQVYDKDDIYMHTALTIAASFPAVDITKTLLELKADPELKAMATPLVEAVFFKNIDCIQSLLMAKADVNKTTLLTYYSDQFGKDIVYTPLQIALAVPRGHCKEDQEQGIKVIKILLDAKADVHISNPLAPMIYFLVYQNDLRLIPEISITQEMLNYRRPGWPTPLCLASSYGNDYLPTLKQLLELKADPNIHFEDTKGLSISVLEAAVAGEKLEVWKKIQNPDSHNYHYKAINSFGRKIISPKIAFLLLDAKADIHYKNRQGENLWQIATRYDQMYFYAALTGYACYNEILNIFNLFLLKNLSNVVISYLGDYANFKMDLEQSFNNKINNKISDVSKEITVNPGFNDAILNAINDDNDMALRCIGQNVYNLFSSNKAPSKPTALCENSPDKSNGFS